MRTPSMVRLVSAIDVARITLRRPARDGRIAARCAAGSSDPWSLWTSAAAPSIRSAVRSISATPGRKASRSPSASSPSARRMAAAISSSIRFSEARPIWCRSSGWMRPSLSITGAPPSRSAKRAPSSVADIGRMRRSGRKAPWASSASARPKSLSRLRSWTSSNSTADTPASSGSSWMRRTKMPSVRTSSRVRADILLSIRVA